MGDETGTSSQSTGQCSGQTDDEAQSRIVELERKTAHLLLLAKEIASADPSTRIFDLQHKPSDEWIGIYAAAVSGEWLARAALDWRVDLRAQERDAARADRDRLLALLEELVAIEGPQPGHVEWYGRVKAAITKARGGR